MKKLLLGAAALTLAFASCKKEESTPSNYIKVSGTSYTYDEARTSFDVGGGYITITGINGSTGTTLFLSFPDTTTPAAGTYRVISHDSTEKAGQVSFSVVTENLANAANTKNYQSTGAGSIDLTVSISNGKYKIVMPDAPALGTDSTTGSTTVSANVTQQ